jgi:hypothetical protein
MAIIRHIAKGCWVRTEEDGSQSEHTTRAEARAAGKLERLYKLTTWDWKTRKWESNETLWGPGVAHRAPGGQLCTRDVLHAYISPEIAAFLNPAHAGIEDPVFWECEGTVDVRDVYSAKVGCTYLRTLRPARPVRPTLRQRFVFALKLAQEVVSSRTFEREALAAEWRAVFKRMLGGERFRDELDLLTRSRGTPYWRIVGVLGCFADGSLQEPEKFLGLHAADLLEGLRAKHINLTAIACDAMRTKYRE